MLVTLQELLQLVESNGIRRVDLKVTDLFGRWQHWTIPSNRLTENMFANGNGFDGSSLRGFQQIQESDMLAMPDINSAMIDPVPAAPTLSLICDVSDPLTRERYSRDPRNVAKKAEEYLKSTGIADTAYFGPELEFFIFDDVRYQQGQNTAFYYIDSSEAHWNSGLDEGGNLGGKIPPKEGYAPAPPFDDTADLRWTIVETIELGRYRDLRGPPRGGDGRPAGNRHDARHAGRSGRPRAVVQVRGPQHHAAARQSRHVHAEADLR